MSKQSYNLAFGQDCTEKEKVLKVPEDAWNAGLLCNQQQKTVPDAAGIWTRLECPKHQVCLLLSFHIYQITLLQGHPCGSNITIPCRFRE